MSDEDPVWIWSRAPGIQVIETPVCSLSRVLQRDTSCSTVKSKGHTACIDSSYRHLHIFLSPSRLSYVPLLHPLSKLSKFNILQGRETEAQFVCNTMGWEAAQLVKQRTGNQDTLILSPDYPARHQLRSEKPKYSDTNPKNIILSPK